MDGKLDFAGLAANLLARAPEWLTQWAPGGRIIGREYTAGTILGGPGDSFKCNIESGLWQDFSTGEKGGDLVALYATINNIKNGEAAKQLADQIGFSVRPENNGARAIAKSEPEIGRPPDKSLPQMIHPKWGNPALSWRYEDQEGLLFYVARYESPEGKQFCPWSWSKTHKKWIPKGWPAPRPLYGLKRLAENPDKPVLVVEGEKAADAAYKIAGGVYAVVSWPNGALAVGKTDWMPLKGKNVLLWPDRDIPGVRAMNEVAQILLPHCPEIKIIEVLKCG